MISSDGSNNGFDCRIREHVVDVLNAVRRSVRNKPFLIQGMWGYLDIEAKCVKVFDTLFDPMGKCPSPTPRWTDDANGISGF